MLRLFSLSFCVALALVHVAVAQTNTTWQTTNGFWSHQSNWTNGIPDGWYNAYITGNAGTINQNVAALQLMGLTIDAPDSNLILDQSLTINDLFNFHNGNISGDGNLTLAAGAVANLGAGARYDGNLANGGGSFRILGSADVVDSFTINGFSELSDHGQVIGGGEFILNNAFVWNGGTMTDSGTTTINAGSLVHNGSLDRTVNNYGQSVVTSVGLSGTSNAVWNNIGDDSFFKITGDQNLSGTGVFNNLDDGLIKKTGGNLSNIDWEFNHQGQMLLVESGKMAFRSKATINGLMTVVYGASIEFQGNTFFGDNVSHGGEGTMIFNGANAIFEHDYDGHFDTIFTNNATLFGPGNVTFHRSLAVSNGNFFGTGELNLYGHSDFSVASIQKTVNNFGNSELTNGLIVGSGNWNNQTDSSISFAGFNNALVGNGQFNNAPGGNVSVTSGNTWIEWEVENSGSISISDASLSFRGDFRQFQSGNITINDGIAEFQGNGLIGGLLNGNGTLISESIRLVIGGVVAPGSGIDSLHFTGDAEFSDEALFDFEIGNSQADLISVDGDLYLDGQVSIRGLGVVTHGDYILFSYSGDLFDNGLALASIPDHLTGNLFYDPIDKTIGLSITSIPEPSFLPIAIFVTALAGRQRKKSIND